MEEVQRIDHQRNLRDHQDEAKLQASSRSSEADSLKSKVSSKAKAIEEKGKIAELLTKAEFMEKRSMIEMEAERLNIQEKVAKAQAKF